MSTSIEDIQYEEQMSRPVYEERFVAFVDILGFAALVENLDTNHQKHWVVVNALKNVTKLKGFDDDVTGIRCETFSDSLIISANANADGLVHMVMSIHFLAQHLLKSGIMIRGALVLGNIHHEEGIAFGPAVNKAARMENSVAVFPRVVMAKRVVDFFKDMAKAQDIGENYFNRELRQGKDGMWFINFLAEIGHLHAQQAPKLNTNGQPEYPETTKHLYNTIIQLLEETVEVPKHFQKVRWLAEYWNSEVCNHSFDNEQIMIALPNGRRVNSLPFMTVTPPDFTDA